MKITASNGYAKLIIFPWLRSTTREDLSDKALNQNVRGTASAIEINHIFDLTIQKALNAPAGSFKAVITATKDYHRIIQPGTWVAVYADTKPIRSLQNLGPYASHGYQMLGIIETITEAENYDGAGRPYARYVLSGRDWGYIYSQSIYFNPVMISSIESDLGTNNAIWNQILRVQDDSGRQREMTPYDNIKFLHQYLVASGVNEAGKIAYTFSVPMDIPRGVTSFLGYPTFPVRSILGIQKYDSNGRIYKLIDDSSISGRRIFFSEITSTTPWKLFNEYLNPDLNEMYTELLPDNDGRLMPTFVVRQRPYSFTETHNLSFESSQRQQTVITELEATKFTSLPRWKISSSQILSKTMSTGLNSLVNFVQVFPTSDIRIQQVAQIEKNWVRDDESIKRWGMRPYVVGSPYLDLDKGGSPLALARPWAQMLADWYLRSHLYESGSVTCYGLPQVRVGEILEIDDSYLYYINGYTINYKVAGTGEKTLRTALTLSRGITSKGSIINKTPGETGESASGLAGKGVIIGG